MLVRNKMPTFVMIGSPANTRADGQNIRKEYRHCFKPCRTLQHKSQDVSGRNLVN